MSKINQLNDVFKAVAVGYVLATGKQYSVRPCSRSRVNSNKKPRTDLNHLVAMLAGWVGQNAL